MRIGIAKPDYGIDGGFELNLRRIESELVQRGHTVRWITVDAQSVSSRIYGIGVPTPVRDRAPDFFQYAALTQRFRSVRVPPVDVLVATQPPSYVVDHPRKLSIFYHHLRIYYDLSTVYTEAGFVQPSDHRVAEAAVRSIDGHYLPSVSHFLAGSDTVRRRLEKYHGFTNISLFQAGLPQHLVATHDRQRPDEVLCVSRHEFPKRTELFAHALKLLPSMQGIAVGGGGRLGYVQQLDERLTKMGAPDAAKVDSRELWLSRHGYLPPRPVMSSNVDYRQNIPSSELASLYARALCVIAPAFDEDYGHTAMEAMAFAKPVIVCSDGGGLTEMVEDGETGYLVEPTGQAIARAVRDLQADPEGARRMGLAGRAKVDRFSWDHAMRQFEVGLEAVAG